MPFIDMPGVNGKIYIPDDAGNDAKKHECADCFTCQMCSDERCSACLNGQKCGKNAVGKKQI